MRYWKLLAILLSIGAPTANAVVFQDVARNGIYAARFDLGHARVIVSLPDDIRAGDVITGTVSTDVAAGSKSLAGYALEVGGNRTALSVGRITFSVPAARQSLDLILRNEDGTGVGIVTVLVRPSTRGASKNFAIPQFGQVVRTLEIIGPFDGSMENTQVSIGSTPAAIVAESPRIVIVRVPSEPIGPTTMTVTERGTKAQGEFRNVAVGLRAGKTSLSKGETTTLTLQAYGLQGLKQNLAIDLVTTEAVSVEGGNKQQILVTPKDVRADGTATFTRALTGVEKGNFNVTASVVDPISYKKN